MVAVLFLYIQCYLLAYSVPLRCAQRNLYALNAIYVRKVLLKCLPCLHSFCTLSLMYICITRYLCNAIRQIVLEMPCEFSLFPHFEITFHSVALNFKLFSQNIPNKMISKGNFNIVKQKCPPVTQIIITRSFSQISLISRTIYLELISRNYSNIIKCVIIFYYKSNNNLPIP